MTIDYGRIPERTVKSLDMYVNHHLEPGGFLRAVLQNNLAKACGRADEENIEVLPIIVTWLVNNAPAKCWGSEDIVERWLEKK
jgi:hypothetical protein